MPPATRKTMTLEQVGAQAAPEAPANLLETEYTFTLVYNGESPPLEGSFTVRRAGVQEAQAEATIVAGLCRGLAFHCYPIDKQALFEALAVCKTRLVKSPEWFNKRLGDLDTEVIFTVAQEARAFTERSFRDCLATGEGEAPKSLVVVLPGVGGGDRKAD